MPRGYIKDVNDLTDRMVIEMFPGKVWNETWWNDGSYYKSLYSFGFLWEFIWEVEPKAGEFDDTRLDRTQCVKLRQIFKQLHIWVGMTDTHAKLHRVIREERFGANKQYFKRNRQEVLAMIADFIEIIDVALDGEGYLWILGC